MLNKRIMDELQEYIENRLSLVFLSSEDLVMEKQIHADISSDELGDFIKKKRKPTFNQVLFNYIDGTGKSDPEIYNKAGIDRKHFSKIRSNADYRPRKNTIIALALALKLSMESTDTLLSSAGYSFSDSETNDLVLQFCLEKGIYDIDEVNQALEYFSLDPLLGT